MAVTVPNNRLRAVFTTKRCNNNSTGSAEAAIQFRQKLLMLLFQLANKCTKGFAGFGQAGAAALAAANRAVAINTFGARLLARPMICQAPL